MSFHSAQGIRLSIAVCGGLPDLLHLDNMWMDEALVVEDFSDCVFGDLTSKMKFCYSLSTDKESHCASR